MSCATSGDYLRLQLASALSCAQQTCLRGPTGPAGPTGAAFEYWSANGPATATSITEIIKNPGSGDEWNAIVYSYFAYSDCVTLTFQAANTTSAFMAGLASSTTLVAYTRISVLNTRVNVQLGSAY